VTITARVQNGVIALPAGTQLPEGTLVEIRTIEELQSKSLAFGWMLKHAGTIDTLPPDFAEHHDDYIRGREPR
jgi:hypothetical protein